LTYVLIRVRIINERRILNAKQNTYKIASAKWLAKDFSKWFSFKNEKAGIKPKSYLSTMEIFLRAPLMQF